MAKLNKNQVMAKLDELDVSYDAASNYDVLVKQLADAEEKKKAEAKPKKKRKQVATGLRTIQDHEARITKLEEKAGL